MKIVFICFVTLVVLSFINPATGQNISYDKFKDFQIDKLEGKELTISFNAELENPTKKNLRFTIKKGKLFKDGKYAGCFVLPCKIKLPKKSNQVYHIVANVSLEKELNLLEEGMALMLSGRKTEVKVSGKLKASWFIFSKKYPFEFQQKLSMKNLGR